MMAPIKNAPRPQVHGTRKAGTKEHAEAGGHAEGRHHDLLEGHGAAALTNAPGEHAGETDERNNSRDEGSGVHPVSVTFLLQACG